METIRKIIGSDIELGNFLLGCDRPGGTGREASRLLLKHMPGAMPARDTGGYYAIANAYGSAALYGGMGSWEPPDPRDFGRKWMKNGGCSYIDSDHLEIATPETTSAWDWAAAYYAQLMIVREAQRRAASELPDGSATQVLVSNSDGRGNSWGSHINVLLTRRAFRNIFEQRMQYLLWLASVQASSTIITGLGKVGSERESAPVDYQISQRADFFEEIVSVNTMFRRPMVNARDESHCFPISEFARFHHIACDSNLCPVANVLKAGILQILLAMVEAESEHLCFSAILEKPLDAWIMFSHDPSLTARARTLDGEQMSALDLQRRIFDSASRFTDAGGCDGIVPRASEILELWGDTLDMLGDRDWLGLSGRLDWVLKKRLLEEAFETSPGITWQSPEAKYLDQTYSNLHPEEGLFWPCLDGGIVEQVIDPERIELFKTSPPEDTRAWTRGRLVSGRGDYRIEDCNWDCVDIRFNACGARGWAIPVYLDAPFGSTRQDNPSLCKKGRIQLEDIPVDTQVVRDPYNKENLICNSKNMTSTSALRKYRK